MKKYLEEVKNQISSLEVKFVQIPKEENECADRLAKATSTEFMSASKQVLSFVQISSLIDDGAQMQEINFEENWTTPLIAYLRSGILPVNLTTICLIYFWGVSVKYKLFSNTYIRIDEATFKLSEI